MKHHLTFLNFLIGHVGSPWTRLKGSTSRKLDDSGASESIMLVVLSLLPYTCQGHSENLTRRQPCIHCHAFSACLALLIFVQDMPSRHRPKAP